MEHDDECAEELRNSGACRHGHGFPGNCDDPNCLLNHDGCPFGDDEEHGPHSFASDFGWHYCPGFRDD